MTTPTQDLILEVLASRTRLGETWWPFDVRWAKQIHGLRETGLVDVMDGPTYGTLRAKLTDHGWREVSEGSYVAPLEDRAKKAEQRVYGLELALGIGDRR